MRAYGIGKAAAALSINLILLYYLTGAEAAVLLTTGILLYAWLGEYLALFRDNAIDMNDLNERERFRLSKIQAALDQDVRGRSGDVVMGLKLHVLPSAQINAFAYGVRHISITRAALDACDDRVLQAVLGHEVSHILCMDAVFHRIVLADITLLISGVIITSFLAVSLLWLAFICFCILGVCGGLFSILAFSGLSRLLKGCFHALQDFLLFIYRVLMGYAGRRCEFRADRYSAALGYGAQLSYFLCHFAETNEYRQKSLHEILYASHPAVYKRIQRIEQMM